MAWYPNATRKPIAPGPTDPPITPRVVILHVDAGNAESLYGWFNGPSGGVESHFFVKKTGEVEQYRSTSVQADANTDANDFAISIETQGFAAGEWTPQQLDSIKALILWCHRTHGIPLAKVKTWDGTGVGYHTQFPGTWDKRGASCPGPDRIRQFNNVLVPWLATGEEDDVDDATIAKIADAVTQKVWAEKLPRTNNPPVAAGTALGEGSINAWRAVSRLKALEPADITSAVSAGIAAAGSTTDVNELAKAIVVELGKD